MLLAAGIAAVLAVALVALLRRDGPPHEPSAPVLAHRAGAGNAPQNSLAGLREQLRLVRNAGSEERPLGGVEVDVVLTADDVPVLSHDPWVHRLLCGSAERPDRPLGAGSVPVLIGDHPLAWLQQQYRCGGIDDADFDGEQRVPGGEPIASLDEVLELLEAAPEAALHLDLKIQPPLTRPAQSYASAIVDALGRRRGTGTVWVEVPTERDVEAFLAAGLKELPGTRLLLSWPPFFADPDGVELAWTLGALRRTVTTGLRLSDPVRAARRSGADGVVSMAPVMTWRSTRRVTSSGLDVVLFHAGGSEEDVRGRVQRLCGWSATALIVDYPGRVGCASP